MTKSRDMTKGCDRHEAAVAAERLPFGSGTALAVDHGAEPGVMVLWVFRRSFCGHGIVLDRI